jgi:hypothetical protein
MLVIQVLNNLLITICILSLIDILLPRVPISSDDVPMWIRMIPGSEIILWILWIRKNK